MDQAISAGERQGEHHTHWHCGHWRHHGYCFSWNVRDYISSILALKFMLSPTLLMLATKSVASDRVPEG